MKRNLKTFRVVLQYAGPTYTDVVTIDVVAADRDDAHKKALQKWRKERARTAVTHVSDASKIGVQK